VVDCRRVYEREAVRQVTGETIRPGGLELTERAFGFSDLPVGARVLDIGCGVGATVEHLVSRGLSAVGLDPSSLLLRCGRRRNPRLPVVQAVGEWLPFADASADAIVAECTLSLMGDAHQALAEIRRVLRPGGRLIVSDLYARNPARVPVLRQLAVSSCLQGARSRESIIGSLHAHGFHLSRWEDHSRLLREMAARAIMTHGSTDCLLCQTAGVDVLPAQIHDAIREIRPGYFLLVARREGEDRHG